MFAKAALRQSTATTLFSRGVPVWSLRGWLVIVLRPASKARFARLLSSLAAHNASFHHALACTRFSCASRRKWRDRDARLDGPSDSSPPRPTGSPLSAQLTSHSPSVCDHGTAMLCSHSFSCLESAPNRGRAPAGNKGSVCQILVLQWETPQNPSQVRWWIPLQDVVWGKRPRSKIRNTGAAAYGEKKIVRKAKQCPSSRWRRY